MMLSRRSEEVSQSKILSKANSVYPLKLTFVLLIVHPANMLPIEVNISFAAVQRFGRLPEAHKTRFCRWINFCLAEACSDAFLLRISEPEEPSGHNILRFGFLLLHKTAARLVEFVVINFLTLSQLRHHSEEKRATHSYEFL